MPGVKNLWRNLLRRDRVERDLDDELRATVALLADEKVRAGMAPDEAYRAARAELGAVEAIKDNIRDAVKERYGQAALRAQTARTTCCGAGSAEDSCCDPITSNLYSIEESGAVPELAMRASLGCGNPTRILNDGEAE